MRIPLSDTLRRLNRYWLLNHPLLWIMRLHWIISFWLVGLILVCLLALALPAPPSSVNSLPNYFSGALALTGLAMIPYFYLQARLASQLRQNLQARAATYLLAGYLLIFGIHLAWPYTLVHIMECRISSKISESDLKSDFADLSAIAGRLQNLPFSQPPNWAHMFTTVNRLSKYRQFGSVTLGQDKADDEYWQSALKGEVSDMLNILKAIARIKGVALPESYGVRGAEASTDLAGTLYFSSYQLLTILWLVLLLRIFQTTDPRSFSVTVFLVVAAYISAAFYSPSNVETYGVGMASIPFAPLLFLFSGGLYAALRVIHLKQRSVWFAVGLNVFTLLLMFIPALLFVIAASFFYWSLSDSLLSVGFAMGVIMQFVAMPWIHRRYLNLQAKPA